MTHNKEQSIKKQQKKERSIKAQAWSMAWHHNHTHESSGLYAGLFELGLENPLDSYAAGMYQLTYEAVREMIGAGATPEDTYTLAVGREPAKEEERRSWHETS